MKKFYAFFAAALMSASLFAGTVPTAADLAAEYDVANNVVFCIQFIDDAKVCNDIRFVGTPNNWGKGEGETESWDNCEKFEPVPGFDGWYAAELPYSEGFQGKPLQEPTNRAWTWDYQCGDKAAWVHVDGGQLTITDGYADECNIAASAAGAYIYQLKYWKKHKSPCEKVIPHTYTVNLYAPNACADMKPAIIGNFNEWKEGVAMAEKVDEEFETYYTYTFNDQEGHEFKFKEATDTDWTNELQYYDNDSDAWYNFKNFELGADTVLTYVYSDNELYRFAKCNGETPEYVIVGLKSPAGAPAAGIEIIGSFDGWTGVMMEQNPETGWYLAYGIEATASDVFKFREAGTWDNEILVWIPANDENPEGKWEAMDNISFGSVWKDDTWKGEPVKLVELDFSNPAKYCWKANWVEGIENVVLTEKANKVMVDGILYIVRDNKMFNVQGTQVR